MTLRLRRMLSASIAWMLPISQCELYCVGTISIVLLCRQQWLQTAVLPSSLSARSASRLMEMRKSWCDPTQSALSFAPSRCNACCVHPRPFPLLVAAEIPVASSAATRHGASVLAVLSWWEAGADTVVESPVVVCRAV